MEKLVRKAKLRKCPYCGSHKIARIVYGLVHLTPELEKDLKEEKVVLGGCDVEEAKWECVDCGNGF